MTGALTWPGDERAGSVFDDAAVLAALVRVEGAWLGALVSAGIAPPRAGGAAEAMPALVGADDVRLVAAAGEHGGNPVLPLLTLLRERLHDPHPDAARWLHAGLTSQDAVDSALMVCAHDAVVAVRRDVREQIRQLVRLADAHRSDVMIGRTLTQHALPITFGLKAAGWLGGVLDALHGLDSLDFPAQFGGAVGTCAGTVQLGRSAGVPDPLAAARDVAARAAAELDLRDAAPWQTAPAPFTRIGDALVTCTGAWGRIADDVLTLARPEIGEVTEPAGDGRGGSSTMPQKVNPVLSVLVHRAALAAPSAAAQLHVAAADGRDERADGAWHVTWSALQVLARHTVVAASQTCELLTGLQVHPDRMRATLLDAGDGILAEGHRLAELAGAPSSAPTGPDDYLGAAHALVDDAVARAREALEVSPCR